MNGSKGRFWTLVAVVLALWVCPTPAARAGEAKAQTEAPARFITEAVAADVKKELIAKHTDKQKARIERGVDQAAALWRQSDGDAEAFKAFALDNFIADQETLDKTFDHFQYGLEQMFGYFTAIGRELGHWVAMDVGPLIKLDEIFSTFDPYAHFTDDMFKTKAAFVALLNFPVTKLEDRVKEGKGWSRRQWAEARLAQSFQKRVPAEVSQEITKASADGDVYINEYNIWMHHLLDEQGNRPFPSGKKLISHWNLRDELKAHYANPKEGLPKQKMIAQVMDRIITQTIPAVVINNPRVDWNPVTNKVTAAPKETVEASAPPPPKGFVDGKELDPKAEPDKRYSVLLATFVAARKADPYSPTTPTHIARKFEEDRELPEKRVEELLTSIATSPLLPKVAELIEKKLGRKLEPFDVWYNGFKPRGKFDEPALDKIVKKKYPNAAAFQKDIPGILKKLGFLPDKARYLAEMIVVDPARGAGHALGAQRRGDKPHLRTRFEKDGMNYKGFNVALHELGHNVEQVFSLYKVDYTLLARVPNTAFTEAIAFVFQARDLEVLGLPKPDAETERMIVLNDLWMTYEIAGPALVDMAVWHWMYDHPEATPVQLKEATIQIAKDVWNKYYAPVFGGQKDVLLLGIYSHMVNLMMYLPDYPLGHLIAFQIEEKLKKAKRLGDEVERMTSFGAVLPDLWMENATGSPVSAEPMLKAAEAALKK